jgi:hypothetical protein
MSNLIIRNNGRDIEEEIRCMLNDRLILSYGSDTRSEPEIIRLYFSMLSKAKKIPTFQAVTDAVINYNFDSFYEAALMRYENINGNNFSDGSSEEIHDIAVNLEDEYNMTDTANIEYFVEFILKKHKLSCEIEVDDKVFHEEGMIAVKHIRDVRIIAHDCQNILFGSFIEHGIAGYGDFTNYYNIDNDDSTLLLMSGR